MLGFSYMSRSDDRRSLQVFDLLDQSCADLFFTDSAENVSSFLEGSGRFRPDGAKDGVGVARDFDALPSPHKRSLFSSCLRLIENILPLIDLGTL